MGQSLKAVTERSEANATLSHGDTMMIFDSAHDIRVVIRTPWELLLDTVAMEVEVEDTQGRFTLRAGDAELAALVPSSVIVRRRDGSEIHVDVTWGSLTAVGNEARLVVRGGEVRHIEPLRMAV